MSGAASIGLDLGAGKCCVASVRAGAVTVLPNAHGDKTTPSFVAFTDSRSLVGSDARDQAALNAENTFYGIKTVLGRSYKQESGAVSIESLERLKLSNSESGKQGTQLRSLEKDPTVSPYLPVFSTTKDGLPVFEVKYRNINAMLRPEEIAALLIANMKSAAEDQLGCVTNAVISVPVNCSNAQRVATLDAACIAGLESVTLVNSTTAAAIAYWNQRPRDDDCLAVVDFGASSLNLAIVSIENGTVKVQEAFGGSTVGGNFVDECLMQAVIKKFEDKHEQPFEKSPRALMNLRASMEKLKHNLTLCTSSDVQVDSMAHDIDFSCSFSRADMEDSCKQQFEIFRNALRRLAQSKSWATVRTVVLVGGSTRIPAVENLILETLGKPVDRTLDKDHAVACGAALRAVRSCEVGEVLSRRIWFQIGSEA
ncbi:heat shock 70 kDa protein IV-like [Hyalella azteca]|uniref:Heat shock 70 kDa protein IV-like n=1 Tax=Hyalella azteca TaxID=294128 RepID=A0A979FJ22_HYAAZ|nr:heat shock 70 kDa protein IV-like [Hyalella azteca]